ncbi:MAG TPA: hypothetical protein V6C81_19285 [Planktothrix sp.]|jgi:ABC-type uncharacterized transport system fused permease/ATPase subunit
MPKFVNPVDPNKITGLALVARLYRVTKPFFFDKASRLIAPTYLIAIVTLMYVSSQLTVDISHALKHHMNTLNGQPIFDSDGVFMAWLTRVVWSIWPNPHYLWLIDFLIMLAIIDPVQVFGNYLQSKLAVVWRQFLAMKYLRRQFTGKTALHVERDGHLDNSDQRITDNIREFTAISVSLFVAFGQGLISVLVWTPDLWHTSPLLTVSVYVWALLVSVVSAVIGKPLVDLNYGLNKREADLRFTLQESRREAEAIAKANGEEKAYAATTGRLSSVIEAQLAILRRNVFVQLFTTYANGIVPWMAPVLIAPLLVAGTAGDVVEAGLAVTSLFAALSLVVNQFTAITIYLALAERLDALQESQKKYATATVLTLADAHQSQRAEAYDELGY